MKRTSEAVRHITVLLVMAVILWFVVLKPSLKKPEPSPQPPRVDWNNTVVQSHTTTPDLQR